MAHRFRARLYAAEAPIPWGGALRVALMCQAVPCGLLLWCLWDGPWGVMHLVLSALALLLVPLAVGLVSRSARIGVLAFLVPWVAFAIMMVAFLALMYQ